MRLSQIKNQHATVVEVLGGEVLFSYSTPVAARIDGKGWMRTDQFYSRTTTRHINQWIPSGADVRTVPQATLDTLIHAKVRS